MTNNETYFEFDDELNEGFTTVPNFILNDTRLTFKAVGVYVQILQYRNTGKHKVYLKSLANYRKDKKTAVSTGLKELEECGYITKINLRNEKGQMNGIKYIVRMKPIVTPIENTTNEPKTENLTSEKPVSDFTPLKIKSFNKKNVLKENIDDVVVKEQQILNLYKSFKIEKRVMPHMVKLLKQYTNQFDLNVFEYIFIQATEESVKKKYNYIKTMLEDFAKANIKTINDLESYNKKFKENKKSNKDKTKKFVPSNKPNRAHNVNNTFTNYSPDGLEKQLRESQKGKFNNPIQDDTIKKDYRALAIKELQSETNLKVEDNSIWKKAIDERAFLLEGNDIF